MPKYRTEMTIKAQFIIEADDEEQAKQTIRSIIKDSELSKPGGRIYKGQYTVSVYFWDGKDPTVIEQMPDSWDVSDAPSPDIATQAQLLENHGANIG